MAEALLQDAPFVPPAPVPGVRDLPPIQQFIRSITRSIEGWPKAMFEERSWRPPLPGMPVFLMDPAAIRAVYVEQAEHFPQGALWRRMIRPVWGDGMVVAEGAPWRWQRHAAAPAFRPAQMHALAPIMARAAEAALARWKGAGCIDLTHETGIITFDVLLDAILSGGEDFDRATVRARISAFMADLARLRLSYFFTPDSFHETRRNRAAPEAADLRRDVDAMIRRRREAPPRGDLVDLLLAARDPATGEGLDDAILRDNLLGFIVAGHETSAMALVWALWLAVTHEPTLRRLRAEIAEVAGDAPIAAEHVSRLIFTRQVIDESMRLYPVTFQQTRVSTRDTEVAGIRVRAGERVVIPTYALHRHRMWWRDPDVFDPDRFAPGQPAPDRHLFMPFGAGPRICLGAAFATTELVVILATLVRGADFAVATGHKVWPVTDLALRPEGGLPMDVSVR